MPKSRRGKRKHPHYIKSQPRHGVATGATPVAAMPGPAASPAPPKVPIAPVAAAKPATYPHVTRELRNIAILTGVIIVRLVVLALILH
jgi:hypothetical protein